MNEELPSLYDIIAKDTYPYDNPTARLARRKKRRKLEVDPAIQTLTYPGDRLASRQDVLDALGNVCYLCPNSQRLNVHHIDGMGRVHRALYGEKWFYDLRYWGDLLTFAERSKHKAVLLLCPRHHRMLHRGFLVLVSRLLP